MLQVAGYLLAKDAARHVILDGRTFSRRYQVDRVCAFARELGVASIFVECICSDETVRQRLDRDVAEGLHPAANRTYEMYLTVKARAEPILAPKVVLDTDQDLESAVQSCIEGILR
jgi:adenylylsulfate kinase